MHKIRTAIIGCGRISDKHIKAAIDNADRMSLVAVCDIVSSRAEQRAEEYIAGISSLGQLDLTPARNGAHPKEMPAVYKDYADMLESEVIDLVAICTESGYHPKIAIDCMRRGKHVIIEKPMALSSTDSERMIDEARKNGVKLCISHQNRFNPAIQKLRQALEAGRFGRIIAGNARILWNRGKSYYDQAPWRGTYELDGGCLMNQCIHDIDLLQWMLGGDVEWVHGVTGNYNHNYIEAEDYGSIQIKFKNGAIGNVEGTVCVPPRNLGETLTIIGENGVASIGGLAVNKVETWRFNDNQDLEDDIKEEYNSEIDSVYGSGHTPLYRDVIEAIENDREPYISGTEGKKAMEIILAAYQSNKEGKRITFPVNNIATIDFK